MNLDQIKAVLLCAYVLLAGLDHVTELTDYPAWAQALFGIAIGVTVIAVCGSVIRDRWDR